MSDEKPTLEQRFENLENILKQMESGDASLDETFTLYKQGLGELVEANNMLDDMEKAMQVLNEQGELEEF
jgi:exodeoxyribonuclease VII small subunit